MRQNMFFICKYTWLGKADPMSETMPVKAEFMCKRPINSVQHSYRAFRLLPLCARKMLINAV